MSSLNEKFVANIGDVVWFLKPKYLEMKNNYNRAYFDKIYQGKVIHIAGATNCTTSITVVDINNERFCAVQELFFINFKECLQVFNKLQQVQIANKLENPVIKENWYKNYMNNVKDFINYKYELKIPYKKNEEVNINYNSEKCKTIIKRILFNILKEKQNIEVQTSIEKYSYPIELTEKQLPKLVNIKIEKI